MARVIGLMSGTSLDGADAILARFWEEAGRIRFEVEGFLTHPFPEDLRSAVLEAMRGSDVPRLGELDVRLGEWFAEAARAVASQAAVPLAEIDLLGSHGQTIHHAPGGAWPFSMQLGDAAVLAERTGLTVVHDFRPADLAAGGQGAPLVPFADRALFADPDHAIALLNLGGIANVTLMGPGGTPLLAFDTGPANMVVDRFVERMTQGRERYDRDGAIALRGRVRPDLLATWAEHPFLGQAPPKSTGREAFGHAYADALWDEAIAQGVKPEDLVATTTALTAHSVGQAIAAFAPPDLRPETVIASGGGARNPTLLKALRAALRVPVIPLDARGVSADAKEALAFALFAYQAARGMVNHVPEATGARQARVLGQIVPGRNFGGVLLRAPQGPSVLPPTEQPNPRTRDLDAMTVGQILEAMIEEEDAVGIALRQAQPALEAVIARAEAALGQGGRLFYVGAGTSGRLGVLDAAECPPTFSSPPEWVQGIMAGGEAALLRAVEGAEDDRAAGGRDLEARGLAPRDVVVGIAASGRTPYVHGALERAHALGAWTALLTCNPMDAPAYVETLVPLIVGPEVLAGSTRLKAGTITKLALNMISTATMVRLGKVYRNRMVDLTVSNAKLERRALEMVRELAEVDADRARALLGAADGHVKLAIAMALSGHDEREAARQLAAAHGRLRNMTRPTP